jgi:hypothetical protein
MHHRFERFSLKSSLFNRCLRASLSLAAGCALYAAESGTFTATQRAFWSLQPVKKSLVPAVKDKVWANNTIDAFVLARLEKDGLVPNPSADRITLVPGIQLRPVRAKVDLWSHTFTEAIS